MPKESAKSCRRLEERGGQLLGSGGGFSFFRLLEIFWGCFLRVGEKRF